MDYIGGQSSRIRSALWRAQRFLLGAKTKPGDHILGGTRAAAGPNPERINNGAHLARFASVLSGCLASCLSK